MPAYLIYLLLILAGFICGVLNTLASSGSAVVLPFLVFLGISPRLANGTNRISLVAGFLTATWVLHKKKLIDWKMAGIATIPMVLGTAAGAYLASIVPSRDISLAILVSVIGSFTLILANPRRFINKVYTIHLPFRWYHFALFTAIGVWAGFIVLDTATFLLFAFILTLHYDLIRANALKNYLGAVLSIVSMVVFAGNGDIDWFYGLFLSIGCIGGSHIAGRFAASDSAKKWIFRLLVFIISAEIIYMVIQRFVK